MHGAAVSVHNLRGMHAQFVRSRCTFLCGIFTCYLINQKEASAPLEVGKNKSNFRGKQTMNIEMVKTALTESIQEIAKDKSMIVKDAEKMFIRTRKIAFETMIQGFIAMGGGKTKNEITDYFKDGKAIPTESAWIQQRNKIKAEAFRKVLLQFQSRLENNYPQKEYRFIAADGSTVTYFSTPKYSDSSYYTDPGNSNKGAYSIHVNALYDLEHQTYLDALLQPVRQKDEFSAFCTMADRQNSNSEIKYVYICDRGYCSFNCMAHVIQSGQYFLFRAKDITSKGMTQSMIHPMDDSFDVKQELTLVRYHDKKWKDNPNIRFLDPNAHFDYISEGTKDEYSLSFRLIRFPISDNSFECIVTNLPEDGFPMDRIKKLYCLRWGIETSFRHLKYNLGLSYTHSYKPDGVMIEIFAKLILFNYTSACLACVSMKEKKERKYQYKANFSAAVHNCRLSLFLVPSISNESLTSLLESLSIPIRDDRSNPHLQTAHFRRPHRSNYRPS